MFMAPFMFVSTPDSRITANTVQRVPYNDSGIADVPDCSLWNNLNILHPNKRGIEGALAPGSRGGRAKPFEPARLTTGRAHNSLP